MEYRAFTVNTPSYGEYQKTEGDEDHIAFESYYKIYPKLRIEAVDEAADLAVVSFRSEEKLGAAELAQEDAQKGDRIVVIGNPSGDRFRITYGKVTSAGIKTFDPGDGITNQVLEHSAYEAPGSSGSPAFNEEMEITGLNIGGGRNTFDASVSAP